MLSLALSGNLSIKTGCPSQSAGFAWTLAAALDLALSALLARLGDAPIGRWPRLGVGHLQVCFGNKSGLGHSSPVTSCLE